MVLVPGKSGVAGAGGSRGERAGNSTKGQIESTGKKIFSLMLCSELASTLKLKKVKS